MNKENKNFIDADKTFKLAFNYGPERLNVRFPGEMELMEWWVSTFKKPSYDCNDDGLKEYETEIDFDDVIEDF